MLRRYRNWMHDWETRLTTRDTNRVVRPLDWGLEWLQGWPWVNGKSPQQAQDRHLPGIPDLARAAADPEGFLRELNHALIADSDNFYSYETPSDFRLTPATSHAGGERDGKHKDQRKNEAQFLQFTSAIESSHAVNDRMNARWFPARGKRAVVVVPQWNADADSHNGLCRIFQWLGIASLRVTMPYHDVRKPEELERADYAVSANIARTIAATRQGVVDIRCCLDWLESQGYTDLGIMGTSLGSCYAFLAAAHDPRIRVAAYNHASTYFGDVVWTGQSTRHIRAGIEAELDQRRLRDMWLAISPMSYFEKYQRFPRKSLVIYATYDLTFLPQFSRQAVAEFRRRKLDCKVCILPCGHYTTGETPYKYLDAWYISRFLARAF